jgi:ribosomal protein S18 acetylase RimI-like enzyme
VHPDFRGRGLARQLMQHIIDFAHNEQKLDAIDLHVWEDNLPAIRLYEALGFELRHRELYYRLEL